MSKSITIRWEPSALGGTETFDLDELECESVEEFEALDPEEQIMRLVELLDLRGLVHASPDLSTIERK